MTCQAQASRFTIRGAIPCGSRSRRGTLIVGAISSAATSSVSVPNAALPETKIAVSVDEHRRTGVVALETRSNAVRMGASLGPSNRVSR